MSKTACKNNDNLKLAEIEAYWTKKRKDGAKPKPLPKPPQEGGAFKDIPAPDKPIGTPANTSIHENYKDKELVVGLAGKVADPNTSPWKSNGKLFFRWKGNDYVGSAGAIFLEVLLTAGHNVFDEGEWSDMFYFDPAYPVNGGSFGWSRAAVFTAWQNTADYAYDYAMLQTSAKMNDIGSVGVIRDLAPKGRTWTAIGYPADTPYDGASMMETTGEYVTGANIITMDHNDMTKGSSGGNWITIVDGKRYVNGVQSTRGGAWSYANSPYIKEADYTNLLNCLKDQSCN